MELYDKDGNLVDAEGKIIKTKEELKSNPPQQAEPKPAEDPKPSNRGPGNPNPDEELKTLQAKHDTLKRQYGASSEEALKLKKEKEDLEAALKAANESATSVPVNDEEFKQRVNEVGYAKAIAEIVQAAVQPLAQRTEALVKKDADKVLDSFKADHPGLKDDILVKFDEEFERLSKIYPLQEAMAKAYVLVGGTQADVEVKKPAEEQRLAEETTQQHEKDKAELAANTSGSATPKKPAPGSKEDFSRKQLDQLRFTAMQKEAEGRDATELWVRYAVLEQQLKQKDLSKST